MKTHLENVSNLRIEIANFTVLPGVKKQLPRATFSCCNTPTGCNHPLVHYVTFAFHKKASREAKIA